MLTAATIAALAEQAAARVAQLTDPKHLEHAYVGVAPHQVLELCDQVHAADADDQATVEALRAGSRNANSLLGVVYIRATDLAALCRLAGTHSSHT